jgi:hypothetical protein
MQRKNNKKIRHDYCSTKGGKISTAANPMMHRGAGFEPNGGERLPDWPDVDSDLSVGCLDAGDGHLGK